MDITKDIYRVNDELIELLEKEKKIVPISYEFNQIKVNALKIKFVEKVLCRYQRMPMLELRRPKDNVHAKTLRQNGNKLFQLRGVNMLKALELYNESICYAETGSEDLSIGYANRSAVYFEWRMFDACLKNIVLAKKTGYPKKLMDKIVKREADCMALKKSENESGSKADEVTFDPTLSFAPHPTVPFISEHLSLKSSVEFGRYVVTNEEVRPGQVLAVEDPFLTILLPALRYQRCAHCLNESQFNLVPCRGCTCAMFCSHECYAKAHSTYHRFECPIIDYLFALFNKLHLLAIRTAIMSVLSFGSIEKMQSFLAESGDSEVNVFTTKTPVYESPAQQHFHQIYSLETNESKRSKSDLFQRAVIAAVAYHQLVRHTALADDCRDNEDAQNVLLELLFRFLQTTPTNFHSLTFVDVGQEEVQYGSGAYPFASLINHACAPNILRVSYDQKIVVMALRVIKAGEQLYDNYGFHHCVHSKQLRQKNLHFQYNFVCSCIACRENYPPYVNLSNPAIPNIVSDTDMSRLQALDRKCALDCYDRYCTYMHKYDSHYPCMQLCGVQECLKLCVNVLMKNVPMVLQQPATTQVDGGAMFKSF